jgi:hypothetical protein
MPETIYKGQDLMETSRVWSMIFHPVTGSSLFLLGLAGLESKRARPFWAFPVRILPVFKISHNLGEAMCRQDTSYGRCAVGCE